MIHRRETILVGLVAALVTGSATHGSDLEQVAAPADAPYTVVDGNKVDPKTLDGWKTWRALACEHCHGAEQEGLVGPSLVEKLQTLKKEEFHDLMFKGRPEKGMPPFSGSTMVTKNWEGLCTRI